ncbi:MAG: CoA transferase, partial [Candidatus Lambdaproteobacteria bacterium]|nr:CoA transferase [Candidatus Lambdaproteobacteria bacterium]
MAMGLEGLNVLELGGGVAAAVATKLMADLGANVVKVEPPEGDGARRRGPFRQGKPDPEASGLYLALNPNKRSVALELLTDAGQAGLEKLVRGADLLVHNFHPIEMERLRIEFERFARLNPALVMVSITPFGLTGVHSRWAAADLTVMSAGGWGYVCPGPGTPAELPPIKPFGQHAWIQAGLHAAMVAMGALHGARATGVGEHCDVSAQEVDTAHLGRTLVGWSYSERLETRTGPRLIGPMGFFRCKDGELFMVVIEEDQWHRLKEAMGNPEWSARPEFKTRELRGEHHGEIEELISAWMSAYTAEELFRMLQGKKLCAAPIFRYEQVVAQEQLLARGFVQRQHHPVAGDLVMPGAPYLLRNPWWRLRTPAPRLGEANAELDSLFSGARPAQQGRRAGKAGRPLEGIRVLDFSWVWAGPYCTMQLAHMGAEVIKIESAKRPEYARRLNIYPKGLEQRLNCSGYFNDLNQGKQSVTINLGNPEGVALVKQIAAKSDIVLSNFATGVMERLGLGAPELHNIKPDLIIGAISGFGQTGPCRNYTAYGPALVPVAGISYATGYGDGKAQEVGIAYGDPNAGV